MLDLVSSPDVENITNRLLQNHPDERTAGR